MDAQRGVGVKRSTRKMLRVVRSGLLKASRTFLQTFFAVITGAPLLNLNVSAVKAAAVAGLGAVFALVQRALDETPLPTIPPG